MDFPYPGYSGADEPSHFYPIKVRRHLESVTKPGLSRGHGYHDGFTTRAGISGRLPGDYDDFTAQTVLGRGRPVVEMHHDVTKSACSATNITYVEALRGGFRNPLYHPGYTRYTPAAESAQARPNTTPPGVFRKQQQVSSKFATKQEVPVKSVKRPELSEKESTVMGGEEPKISAQCLGMKGNLKVFGKDIFCNICNVACPGQVAYYSHITGKQHTARSKNDQVPVIVPMPTAEELGVKEDFKVIGNQIFCKICNVGCSKQVSYNAHIIGRQHAARSKGEQWPPKLQGEDESKTTVTRSEYFEFTICTFCITYITKKDGTKHFRSSPHNSTITRMAGVEKEAFKCSTCVISFRTSRKQYEHFASFEHSMTMRKISNLLKFGRDAKSQASLVDTNLQDIPGKKAVALDQLQKRVQTTNALEVVLIAQFGKFADTLPVEFIETRANMAEVERDDDPSTEAMRYCDVCGKDFGPMTTFRWSDHTSTPLHLKKLRQQEMVTSFPKTCEFCNKLEVTPSDWSAHLKTAGHISKAMGGKSAKRPFKEHDAIFKNGSKQAKRSKVRVFKESESLMPHRGFKEGKPSIPRSTFVKADILQPTGSQHGSQFSVVHHGNDFSPLPHRKFQHDFDYHEMEHGHPTYGTSRMMPDPTYSGGYFPPGLGPRGSIQIPLSRPLGPRGIVSPGPRGVWDQPSSSRPRTFLPCPRRSFISRGSSTRGFR